MASFHTSAPAGSRTPQGGVRYRLAIVAAFCDDGELRTEEFLRQQLPTLTEYFQIELFTLFCEAIPQDIAHFAQFTSHYLRFAPRHEHSPFDVILYVLENHEACNFIPQMFAVRPGFVACLDVTMARLFESRLSASAHGSDLDAQLIEEFGASAPPLGDHLQRHWSIDSLRRTVPRGIPFADSENITICPSRDMVDRAPLGFRSPHLSIASLFAHDLVNAPVRSCPDTAGCAPFTVGCAPFTVGCAPFTVGCAVDSVFESRLSQLFEAVAQARMERQVRIELLTFNDRTEKVLQRFATDFDPTSFDLKHVRCESDLRTAVTSWDACYCVRFPTGNSLSLTAVIARKLGIPGIIAFTQRDEWPEAWQVPLGYGEINSLSEILCALGGDAQDITPVKESELCKIDHGTETELRLRPPTSEALGPPPTLLETMLQKLPTAREALQRSTNALLETRQQLHVFADEALHLSGTLRTFDHFDTDE